MAEMEILHLQSITVQNSVEVVDCLKHNLYDLHYEDVTLNFFLLLQTSIQIKEFIHVSISGDSESKGMKRTESKQKHEKGRLTN